jgi:hypothetical protein
VIFQTQDPTKWHRWFAWFPVDIGDHRVAWLEAVERQWNPELWLMADCSGWGVEIGGYVYRAAIAASAEGSPNG